MEAEALHETLDYNAILAQLIAREYFIAERWIQSVPQRKHYTLH
jgi:hypothetical protein